MEWILGTIITIAFAASTWLSKKAIETANEAAKIAHEAIDKSMNIANEAKSLAAKAFEEAKKAQGEAKVLSTSLKAHVESTNKILDIFEKHESERHQALVSAISTIGNKIDEHLQK